MKVDDSGAVWRWPVALAGLTVVGLVSALFVDGIGDAVAWIGLGVPLVVGALCIVRSLGRAG